MTTNTPSPHTGHSCPYQQDAVRLRAALSKVLADGWCEDIDEDEDRGVFTAYCISMPLWRESAEALAIPAPTAPCGGHAAVADEIRAVADELEAARANWFGHSKRRLEFLGWRDRLRAALVHLEGHDGR